MITIEIRPEARAELHEAFAWYEEKQPGLGYQFLFAVDASLERVRRHPRSFPVVTGEVRSALLRRFPFAVIFTFDGERATVFAVYHGHRKPRRWTDRISEPVASYGGALSNRLSLVISGRS